MHRWGCQTFKNILKFRQRGYLFVFVNVKEKKENGEGNKKQFESC